MAQQGEYRHSRVNGRAAVATDMDSGVRPLSRRDLGINFCAPASLLVTWGQSWYLPAGL